MEGQLPGGVERAAVEERVGAEVSPSDDPLVADVGVGDAETAGAGRRDIRLERPKDRSAGGRVRVTRPDGNESHPLGRRAIL